MEVSLLTQAQQYCRRGRWKFWWGNRLITQSTEESQRDSARISPNKKQGPRSLITLAGKRHQILFVSWFGPPISTQKEPRYGVSCKLCSRDFKVASPNAV